MKQQHVLWRTLIVDAALVSSMCLMTAGAWAQEKHNISYSKSTRDSQYTQEHSIEVGDVPGHKVRIFEIHWNYAKGELVFDGVNVKESWVRGMSDYTNTSGPAMNYIIYVLEDGNKVFSRNAVLTQTPESEGGNKTAKYYAVENLYGGTGKFSHIRGQLHQTGSRVLGASALTLEVRGEYWFDE
ncbi:MAG TPA: hypothetical protein VMT29_06105 [Steroidobacteraceae bacterium]|nr:hypothetical protein [Steroidobacteraceae bacterium]